jgi:hypothetical protein
MIKSKPVISTTVMAELAMLPVMDEVGTVEMPLFARMTKLPAAFEVDHCNRSPADVAARDQGGDWIATRDSILADRFGLMKISRVLYALHEILCKKNGPKPNKLLHYGWERSVNEIRNYRRDLSTAAGVHSIITGCQ